MPSVSSTPSSIENTSENGTKNYLIPTIIIGIIFFALGFITWVNSTLIPYLQNACDLTPKEAVLVTFASYISFAVMAFPSSWVLSKIGFKNGMVLGLLIMALGSVIFIPAANSRTFGLFLSGIFTIGIGMALLQTAVNPYITILGPIKSAAKRISIMGLFNKCAGALAPLVMGAILLKDMGKFQNLDQVAPDVKSKLLDELAGRIVGPYIFIAIAFAVVAIAIKFSKLPDIKNEVGESLKQMEDDFNPKKEKNIFSYTYLWLGFIALFLYVGVEVMAGDMIQIYGNQGLGYSLDVAKNFTAYTMAGMIIGYVSGIVLIPKYISQQKALRISAIAGIILSLGIIFLPRQYSIACVALLGLANAQMWPAIWPLSIHGLGKFLKTGSGLLVIGIAGGAIIPKLWANISESIGSMQKAFWILVPCYAFILFFALRGHKIGRTEEE